jgi:hypothetical protein
VRIIIAHEAHIGELGARTTENSISSSYPISGIELEAIVAIPANVQHLSAREIPVKIKVQFQAGVWSLSKQYRMNEQR